VAPVPTGLALIDQPEPLQLSASGSAAPVELEVDPAATHADAEGHDTPLKSLVVAPAGLGVDSIAQADPFQRSASVKRKPLLLVAEPTAVQAVAVGQETPVRTLRDAPDGSSVVC
jgi:hypothetical protein